MIRDGLLALGLLLSTATQFRVPGSPLGPGELLLAAWIFLSFGDVALRRVAPLTPAAVRLLAFWALFTFSLCLGLFMGFAIEDYRDTGSAIKTVGAYVLGALVSVLMVAPPKAGMRLRRVAWMTAATGALCVTAMLAAGHGALALPGLDFWVYSRFLGWSVNPNQFALLCTVLVLLSLHLTETTTLAGAKLVGFACAVPVFVAGLLTRSDSFVLAMLVACPMFVGTKLLAWAFVTRGQRPLRAAVAGVVLLAVPLVLAAMIPFTPKVLEMAGDHAAATMEQNDQAEGRFRLWREATQIGLEAGMLGLGPSSHIASKRWKLPPPQKGEAHNTAFDLFTQGGILATLAFFWLTATAIIATCRANLIGLASLVMALFVFSNFHLVVRHPIYWFSIALCLVAADSARTRKVETARPDRDRIWHSPPPRPT